MAASTTEIAEKAAWRRARAATVLAMVFVGSQVGSFRDEWSASARPETLHLSAWVAWAAALLIFLLFFLVAGGGLFRGKRIRAVLNDETTQDHRLRAMAWGFWGAIGTATLVWVLSFFEPVTAREGVRLVITFGVAVALLRFGTLERKALKNG